MNKYHAINVMDEELKKLRATEELMKREMAQIQMKIQWLSELQAKMSIEKQMVLKETSNQVESVVGQSIQAPQKRHTFGIGQMIVKSASSFMADGAPQKLEDIMQYVCRDLGKEVIPRSTLRESLLRSKLFKQAEIPGTYVYEKK